MIYENELVQFKPRKKVSGMCGLQIFDFKYQQKLPHSRIEAYRQLLQQHGEQNKSTHGVCYICNPKLHLWVRFMWAVVLCCAIIGCVTMYVSLWDRHKQQQMKTVVETTQLPIYSIEFPAVALCLRENLNWNRVVPAHKVFLQTQANDTMPRVAFRHLLLIMEQLDFRDIEKLSEIVMEKSLLQLLNGINITELAHFLAFRCYEILRNCVFDGTPYDCCKLFVAERTERGICLVFNSLISLESKQKKLSNEFYPWKIGKAGEGSGLKFTLRYNGNNYRRKNVTHFVVNLMIKKSEQWSETITHPLYGNTNNYISIWPQMTVTSKNTRKVNPEKRHCLFTDENTNQYGFVKGLPYGRQNCHALCMQKHLLQVCNCTIPLFFPSTDEENRECGPTDLICIYENRDIFSYAKTKLQDLYIKDERRGLICNCVENCFSLVYLLTQNSRAISKNNRSEPQIMVDIHYGQRVMTKYLTYLEYIELDLLAHFGGVLGLFLGASALSLTEFMYVGVKIIVMLLQDRKFLWSRIKSLLVKNKNKIYPKIFIKSQK